VKEGLPGEAATGEGARAEAWTAVAAQAVA
jgi:hypothetical protein